MLTPKEYSRLAQDGATRIPVVRVAPMGNHTPLGIYHALAARRDSCLLESALEGGGTWSRYSMIVPRARCTVRVQDGVLSVYNDGVQEEQHSGDNPFELLRTFMERYKAPSLPQLPPFHGGLVGYFAYDTLRYAEARLMRTPELPHPLKTPDIALLVAEELFVVDRKERNIKMIVLSDPDKPDAYDGAQGILERMRAQLETVNWDGTDLTPVDESQGMAVEQESQSNFDRQQYGDAVERIREYILAGDVMQVVPSRRASVPFTAKPFDVYRALRQINPSPYMYFLDFGDFQIAGSSPEILARLRGRTITTRPIAGTRRRGRTPEEDRAMEAELLSDPKELAEHLMLIDLGRNDVGRIAKIGSVRLAERMQVERYSHVMHIVSTVDGELAHGDALDVLRSVLPAGTLSGAPKIRAMEIIAELEPVRRGMYGGAVGYLACNGDMDMAVAIRTTVIRDGVLYAQAGGGIVADSMADLEWKETENKARVMFRAVAMARAVV